MPFWRLRELNLLRWSAASFLLLFASSSASAFAQESKGAAETPPRATLVLKVTLIGITSYRDFREIRAALAQSEGMEKVTLETEAPGLVTFSLRYGGEPGSLIEQLHGFFPKRYSIKEKHTSGGTEITISSSQ